MEKASGLPADMIILDLEDAVAPEAKLLARQQVAATVAARPFGRRETLVRINALDSIWGRDDLSTICAAKPHGILVPKITGPDEIFALDAALSDAEGGEAIALWVMIEMPAAIMAINDIARCAATTRLTGFIMGNNDLAKEMNAQNDPERTAFQFAMQSAIMAAKAYRIAIIDSVYNNFSDTEGLERECRQSRRWGFDGKTAIHPAQLDTCNRIFAPDAAELADAQEIIAAFAQPENHGKGAIKINGKMTELLHLQQARRTVAIAESIAALHP
jgi:citrate lyase subunit beta/citryl-CoA lyase